MENKNRRDLTESDLDAVDFDALYGLAIDEIVEIADPRSMKNSKIVSIMMELKAKYHSQWHFGTAPRLPAPDASKRIEELEAEQPCTPDHIVDASKKVNVAPKGVKEKLDDAIADFQGSVQMVERSRNAVEVAERFANGEATEAELAAAWDAAARSAARDAALFSAWDAAGSAARSASWDAAWGARDTAQAAQIRQFQKMIPNPFIENELKGDRWDGYIAALKSIPDVVYVKEVPSE